MAAVTYGHENQSNHNGRISKGLCKVKKIQDNYGSLEKNWKIVPKKIEYTFRSILMCILFVCTLLKCC